MEGGVGVLTKGVLKKVDGLVESSRRETDEDPGNSMTTSGVN